jgi:hypothetical protein
VTEYTCRLTARASAAAEADRLELFIGNSAHSSRIGPFTLGGNLALCPLVRSVASLEEMVRHLDKRVVRLEEQATFL